MNSVKFFMGVAGCTTLLMLSSPLNTFAQNYEEEYEWNPREGLHEEEWYDPGDWFDYDTGVDYDYDWWNYPYYGYDYEPYDYDYDYYEPYDYDYDDGYGYYEPFDYDPYTYDYNGYDTYGFDDDWGWDPLTDQSGESRRNRSSAQSQQQARQSGTQQGSRTVRGDIQELRTIEMQPGQREIVATIRTNQGQRQKVLLGPVNQVRDYKVSQGDRIRVSGNATTIRGQQMLIANRFKLDQMQNWARVKPSVRPTKWYHGEIQNTRTVRFRGLDRQQKVAQVRLDDGKVLPVNLGPANDLPNQALQQGERITVAAKVGKVNGQAALVAERIRLDSGRTIQVDREAEKLAFQRKASREEGQASAQQRR